MRQDGGCESSTSDEAIVVVQEDIAITTQPTGADVCIDGDALLSVTITGGSGTITYQWESSTDGTTWSPITGATNSTYDAPTDVAGTTYYRVVIDAADGGCESSTSDEAIVVVQEDIAITTQPTGADICIDGDALLSVTITGGSGDITYQWESSTNGTDWSPIAGATNSTYDAPTDVAGTTYYRVVIDAADGGCESSTSDEAIVVVQEDIAITTQPTGADVCIDGDALLTVTITGGSGTITYQWESSTDGTTWSPIAGATNSTYDAPTDVAGTTYYRVVIDAADGGCESSTSDEAIVVVQEDIAITTQPTGADVCIDGDALLSVTITGGSGTITYQWESSADGTTWSPITGATNSTYDAPTDVAGTTYYRVVIDAADGGCESSTSDEAIVVVQEDIAITTQPTGADVCIDGDALLSVTITGGSGTITYQWESSINGTDWSPIAGATNSTYDAPTDVAGTTYYRVVIDAADGGCESSTSDEAIVVVQEDIAITTQPTGADVCIDGDALLSVTITGGSGTITYQWESSADGTTWSPITGATNSTYDAPTDVASTTYYRVVIDAADGGCESSTSDEAIVVVQEDIAITTQPTGADVCIDGDALLSVTITGGSGTITYQWESSTDGTTWSPITGATNSTYDAPTDVAGTTYYRVVIDAADGGCESSTSDEAIVVVQEDIAITTQPTGADVCIDGDALLSVTITGGSGTITYQWESSADGTTWSPITGATNSTYDAPTDVASTTYYRVVIDAADGGCESSTSDEAIVVVQEDIAITTQPTGADVCIDGDALLSVTITGGSGTITYQWESSTDGTTWSPITGATNSTYDAPTDVAGTTYYRVVIDAADGGCESSTSDEAIVVVQEDIAITTQPTGADVCIDGDALLSVTITGGSGTITYQWESSTDGSTWSPIAGATNSTYDAPTDVAGTTYYRVVIDAADGGCESSTSDEAIVVVQEDIAITTQPTGADVCIDGDALLSVTITGGSGTITYQWESSADGTTWSPITGATNSTYDAPTDVAGTTYYRVVIDAADGGCESSTSDEAIVVVQEDIAITTQPTGADVCIDGDALLSVTITGGSGDITYQWESSTNGTDWSPIAGATNNTYDAPTDVAGTTYYRVVIDAADGGCESSTSDEVIVVVQEDIAITTQPTGADVCIDGDALLSVTITGGSGTITYQWESSTDGTTWSPITGATNSTYDAPTDVAGTTYYRVVIDAADGGCESSTSDEAIVVVQEDIAITTQPTGADVCIDGDALLSVTITGGSGDITYQWESSTNGTDWSPIAGATNSTYDAPTDVAGTTYYRVVIDAADGGCESSQHLMKRS